MGWGTTTRIVGVMDTVWASGPTVTCTARGWRSGLCEALCGGTMCDRRWGCCLTRARHTCHCTLTDTLWSNTPFHQPRILPRLPCSKGASGRWWRGRCLRLWSDVAVHPGKLNLNKFLTRWVSSIDANKTAFKRRENQAGWVEVKAS